VLRHLWDGWRRPLRLVQPETVIKWHRKSWRMWWRWKSKTLRGGLGSLDRSAARLRWTPCA
jgi:hypothetical protein